MTKGGGRRHRKGPFEDGAKVGRWHRQEPKGGKRAVHPGLRRFVSDQACAWMGERSDQTHVGQSVYLTANRLTGNMALLGARVLPQDSYYPSYYSYP
jgi:hypothetical protein